MKKGYKAIAVTLSMVLALTGVVGGAPVKGEAKAKIKLNKKKVTLTVGKSVKLKLKGTGKKAKWSSSNESVAMVSSTGKVMAVSVGKAKIRAKIKKKKYSCSVTVKGKTTEPEKFWPVTQTKTPTATKAPAATVPVRKTNAPSNTKNPAGTGRPYGTNVPGKTDAPEVTKTPVKTEEPEETKAPAKTEEPEETKTPVKTEKPNDTASPEDTKKPEQTASPENPSRPEESYTPDIPVVTPGSADAENEALASNMKASFQKLSNGKILMKLVNNNDVTVNYFTIKITWKDAQGNTLTYETSDGEVCSDTSFSAGYFLEKNGLYYDMVYAYSENKDKVDLSKSEISIEVDQTLWEDNNYTPLTSKIAVTTQRQMDEEDGSSKIVYEIKNNDSQSALISMVILFKDAQGNVVDEKDTFETVSAGETVSDYLLGPWDDNYEDIDFASYEVHINGHMYEASES